jgi:anti-sigma regulatory factor (Ser/Thr protein kinase)
MRNELALLRNLQAPRLARAALAQWYSEQMGSDKLEAGQLLVSELVSNAVQHGDGQILLRSELNEDRLVIEVVDDGSGFEHTVRNVPFDALSGRGLAIVDAISTRWGVHEGTTHVWAEIERKTPRRDAGQDPNESP